MEKRTGLFFTEGNSERVRELAKLTKVLKDDICVDLDAQKRVPPNL